MLPELLHDDIYKLLLNGPWLVHGAEVGGGHTVGHHKVSTAAATQHVSKALVATNTVRLIPGSLSHLTVTQYTDIAD